MSHINAEKDLNTVQWLWLRYLMWWCQLTYFPRHHNIHMTDLWTKKVQKGSVSYAYIKRGTFSHQHCLGYYCSWALCLPIIMTNYKTPSKYAGGRLITLVSWCYGSGSGLSYENRILICLPCHSCFCWNHNLETCWKLYSSSSCPIQHCFRKWKIFW